MIKAIETRYAGCKFRSRLEARWAVFFDHFAIKWEYEYQGYQCTHRLTHNDWSIDAGDGTFPYLPDFWFPDLHLHGEVKGSLTHPELTRLLDAAASLSSNDGGGCRDSGGHDLIIFGNIPLRVSYATDHDGRLPTRLHMHKGDLNASGWTGEPDGCACGDTIAYDCGGDPEIYEGWGRTPDQIARWLTSGSWASSYISFDAYQTWEQAFTAARSARFEHGQSGA